MLTFPCCLFFSSTDYNRQVQKLYFYRRSYQRLHLLAWLWVMHRPCGLSAVPMQRLYWVSFHVTLLQNHKSTRIVPPLFLFEQVMICCYFTLITAPQCICTHRMIRLSKRLKVWNSLHLTLVTPSWESMLRLQVSQQRTSGSSFLIFPPKIPKIKHFASSRLKNLQQNSKTSQVLNAMRLLNCTMTTRFGMVALYQIHHPCLKLKKKQVISA